MAEIKKWFECNIQFLKMLQVPLLNIMMYSPEVSHTELYNEKFGWMFTDGKQDLNPTLKRMPYLFSCIPKSENTTALGTEKDRLYEIHN